MDEKTKKGALALVTTALDVGAKLGGGLPAYAASKGLGAIGAIVDLRRARLLAELKEMFEMAAEENWTDEGYAAWINSQATSETFQDTVHETARAYGNRRTREILPALGALFREYHRTGTPPDAFYDGFLNCFCALSADEYFALRDMMVMLDDGILEPKSGETEFQMGISARGASGGTLGLSVFGVDGAQTRYSPIASPHFRRIFRLLTSNDLARGAVGSLDDNQLIALTRDEIARLRRLLRPKG